MQTLAREANITPSGGERHASWCAATSTIVEQLEGVVMAPIEAATGLQLDAPGVFSQCVLPTLEAGRDEVVVEVAACGLCHTDVGFAYGGVPTRHPLPLILGHEIAGRVVDAGEYATAWLGRAVIVPAVIPCEACEACRSGRPTICRRQFMPRSRRGRGRSHRRRHDRVLYRGQHSGVRRGVRGAPRRVSAVHEALQRRGHVDPAV